MWDDDIRTRVIVVSCIVVSSRYSNSNKLIAGRIDS